MFWEKGGETAPGPAGWMTQRPRIEANITGGEKKVTVMVSNVILLYALVGV